MFYMNNRDRIILQKICNYIDDITFCIRDSSFPEFMEDKKTIFACAFAVSQIGELSKEVSEKIQKRHIRIKSSCFDTSISILSSLSEFCL